MADSPTLAPGDADTLHAAGAWTLAHAATLERLTGAGDIPHASTLDATGITRLDSAGALALYELVSAAGMDADAVRLADSHVALYRTVVDAEREPEPEHPRAVPAWRAVPTHVGETLVTLVRNQVELVAFLGQTLATAFSTLLRPSRFRITPVVHHMEQTGLNALPLVALLSFLVGMVVAFLGATVLREFGAELFVVDLVTYAFLREFGVLLTAILLAGRTASAYTAQIGTMKSREEIDAMRTLGQDPIVLLVLPRVLALLVMLPLLAVMATVAGLAGGMVVCATVLDISPELFISRAYEMAELRHYLVGLFKAPLFALVIALVGCLEGFRVAGTAQSVGERTTSAVVQSISLVILINAAAAVFFMEIGW